MDRNSTTRRRWFGAFCLCAAIAMLVADATVLKHRLTAFAALAYWLACFLFTLLAISAAFLDLRALRRSIRDEQRALFENTLQNISKEKSAKTGDPK